MSENYQIVQVKVMSNRYNDIVYNFLGQDYSFFDDLATALGKEYKNIKSDLWDNVCFVVTEYQKIKRKKCRKFTYAIGFGIQSLIDYLEER